MSNKVIYPILIIIFSVLVIYAIINNRNNSKLNSNVEKFTNIEYFDNTPQPLPIPNSQPPAVNFYLPESQDLLKSSASNNTLFTSELINGSWTSDVTTVDSNYIASNLLTINVTGILNAENYNNSTNNYGTVIYNNQTYTINFLLNENLTAVVNNGGGTTQQNLHIKFYNNFDSKEGQTNTNPVFYRPDEFNSVVSIYAGSTLINKFASYKIYDPTNKIGDELYRIIISNNTHIAQAPPIYDYNAYNIITGKYQFPSNYVSLSFGTSNANVLNTINSNYLGNISFCIQRVFYSPTNDNTEIITAISPRIVLGVVSNGQIPNKITICSFQNDQTANGLKTFFRPKATILYFYKFIRKDVTYQFANPNNINSPNSVLQTNTAISGKNNGSGMTAPNLIYNDLGSVEEVINNYYTIQFVQRYNSNLTDNTVINFSDLYSPNYLL